MATGQCLQIVHLIPVSMLVEEEVNLEGGISPKIDRKPKLEKISPGMWMLTNSKILLKIMESEKL